MKTLTGHTSFIPVGLVDKCNSSSGYLLSIVTRIPKLAQITTRRERLAGKWAKMINKRRVPLYEPFETPGQRSRRRRRTWCSILVRLYVIHEHEVGILLCLRSLRAANTIALGRRIRAQRGDGTEWLTAVQCTATEQSFTLFDVGHVVAFSACHCLYFWTWPTSCSQGAGGGVPEFKHFPRTHYPRLHIEYRALHHVQDKQCRGRHKTTFH